MEHSVDFKVGDAVTWHDELGPEQLRNIVALHGRGPFTIAGLQFNGNRLCGIGITFVDGQNKTFAGQWFRKV